MGVKLPKTLYDKTMSFTQLVLIGVAIIYILNWIVSLGLIFWAIKETGSFAYLDTLITETSTTFRDIVGVIIVKFAVENVFKYNDFGGKVPSKEPIEEAIKNDN